MEALQKSWDCGCFVLCFVLVFFSCRCLFLCLYLFLCLCFSLVFVLFIVFLVIPALSLRKELGLWTLGGRGGGFGEVG